MGDESDCSQHEGHDHSHEKDHSHHAKDKKGHEHAKDEKEKEHKHHHKHEKEDKSHHDHDKHEAGEEATHGKDGKHKKKDKHKHKHKRKSKKNKTQTLQHSSGVSSLGFEREGEVVEERFEQYMPNVIRNYGANIYRAKGIINISGNPNKLVFHGVHELFDTNNQAPWGKDDKKTNKLVFIGKDLRKDILQKGFGYCLIASDENKLQSNVDDNGVQKRPLKPSEGGLQSKKPRTLDEETAVKGTSG